MNRIIAAVTTTLVAGVAAAASVQAADHSMLDPRNYDTAHDPDYTKYIATWRDNEPRATWGDLTERDVFTRWDGDPLKPVKCGQVLTHFKRFTHGELPPGGSTGKVRVEDEQLILYVASGEGVIDGKGVKKAVLREDVGVLIPPKVDFTITCTGGEPLALYMIAEPLAPGFKPNGKLLVRDTDATPISGSNGHWCHIYSGLFSREDGLSTMIGIGKVLYDPMTIGQPHAHVADIEEIWFALDGDIRLMLGKNMVELPVGYAYKVPPNGMTAHSNINVSDKPVKLVWFMKIPEDQEPAKDYGSLDPAPYTPGKDPNIDMFMRNWRESMPAITHGTLVERPVLTKGDPLTPSERGAVLKYVNRFTHATLAAGSSTRPATLDGEQLILYITGGEGVIRSGASSHPLRYATAVLIPGGLEYTMENTGDVPLTMYLVAEPCPAGFRMNDDLLVRDGDAVPLWPTKVHWCGDVRPLFTTADGLGTLESILTVDFAPDDFFHPHSHIEGCEEVWTTVSGDIDVLFGKQVRVQPPGTAYLIPVDNNTAHANFNVSDAPARMFYFARYRDHDLRK